MLLFSDIIFQKVLTRFSTDKYKDKYLYMFCANFFLYSTKKISFQRDDTCKYKKSLAGKNFKAVFKRINSEKRISQIFVQDIALQRIDTSTATSVYLTTLVKVKSTI